MTGSKAHWLAAASIHATRGNVSTLVVKLVNYGNASRPVVVGWSGARPLTAASAQVLTAASPDAENTLEQPDAVVPAALEPPPAIAADGHEVHVTMPPWSLVILSASLTSAQE